MPFHPFPATDGFDGGDLDCGNGLLLLIRKHLDPLFPGQLLEIKSTEPSVDQDLPAWCRLTGNELVSQWQQDQVRSFLVAKGTFQASKTTDKVAAAGIETRLAAWKPLDVKIPEALPEPAATPLCKPLSVMGVGSWPRPRWMLRALHEFLEGRLDEQEFHETANDAVRLAVDAQERAEVDVVTDGEQRRDNYSSFVGSRLDNCQLIPITDLLPLVDHPDEFETSLRSLDVPAEKVRHPAVFGPLGRSRSLTVHEFEFARKLSDKPFKVALPGPYLLTRTMWMECISDRVYATRDALAKDIVRVLREELHALLAAGVALVQFDEPVLSEVVFGEPVDNRTFMCGALGERLETKEELEFAAGLVNEAVSGLPRERIAVHVCRGNWTPDETAALRGDYTPMLPALRQLDVGTLFLELCTPRAGELEVLQDLDEAVRIGVGVVNPKDPEVETVEAIARRIERGLRTFGERRVLLTPDCGFATFADNPVTSARIAEQKLHHMVQARNLVHG